MGIRSGSRKGGSDGGRRRNKANNPIEALQTPRPYLPTPKSPFPFKDGFRLGVYEIEEEKDDYLICKGFDPNAQNPFSEYTPAAHIKANIAKPPLLQKTPWDGKSITLGGVSYSYAYSSTYQRTKSWTDDDDEDQSEDEEINVPYFVGDIIVAAEVQKNQYVDGLDKVNDTRVQSEAGALLSWVDINVSGRGWVGPGSSAVVCDPQSAIHDITVFGSPDSGTFTLTYSAGGAEEILEFDYNNTASEVTAIMEGHAGIEPGDVVVQGDFPDETVRILFGGQLQNTAIALPVATWGGLAGVEGIGIICAMAQLGIEEE